MESSRKKLFAKRVRVYRIVSLINYLINDRFAKTGLALW